MAKAPREVEPREPQSLEVEPRAAQREPYNPEVLNNRVRATLAGVITLAWVATLAAYLINMSGEHSDKYKDAFSYVTTFCSGLIGGYYFSQQKR